MQPNPKQEAERWLFHAERDLGFARMGIELGGYYSQTCFMARQSAEKALKALLYLRGMRLIREDSVSELLMRVTDVHPGLDRYEIWPANWTGITRFLATLASRRVALLTKKLVRPRRRKLLGRGRTLYWKSVI